MGFFLGRFLIQGFLGGLVLEALGIFWVLIFAIIWSSLSLEICSILGMLYGF